MSDSNTIKVNDPSSVDKALEESEFFEKNASYGDVGDEQIGSQYVSPDAGIVVSVNYSREGDDTVTATTMKDTAPTTEYNSVDEVERNDYDQAVSEYVDEVMTQSSDINDVDGVTTQKPGWQDEEFREEVENWFEDAYDESRKVMADGGFGGIPTGGAPDYAEKETEDKKKSMGDFPM